MNLGFGLRLMFPVYSFFTLLQCCYRKFSSSIKSYIADHSKFVTRFLDLIPLSVSLQFSWSRDATTTASPQHSDLMVRQMLNAISSASIQTSAFAYYLGSQLKSDFIHKILCAKNFAEFRRLWKDYFLFKMGNFIKLLRHVCMNLRISLLILNILH